MARDCRLQACVLSDVYAIRSPPTLAPFQRIATFTSRSICSDLLSQRTNPPAVMFPPEVAFVPTSFPLLSTSTAAASSNVNLNPLTSHRVQVVPNRQAQIPNSAPVPPAPARSPSRVLLWFHTDLRVVDNPALCAAVSAASIPGGTLVPVAAGGALDSTAMPLLSELKTELNQLGSDLVVMPGRVDKVLVQICRQLKLNAVYFNRSVLRGRVQVEKTVVEALTNAGIHVEAFWGNLLQTPSDSVLAAQRGKEMGLRDMGRHLTSNVQQMVEKPRKLPALSMEARKLKGQRTVNAKVGGGWSAAMKVLNGMEKEKEGLRLSKRADLAVLLKVFLDYGAISSKMVAQKVVQVMGKRCGRTFSELVWREYICVMAHRAVGVRTNVTTVSV